MSQAYLFMCRCINRKYNELYQIFKLSYTGEEHKSFIQPLFYFFFYLHITTYSIRFSRVYKLITLSYPLAKPLTV